MADLMIPFDEYQAVLSRLPEGARLSTHRCWTCARCKEAFGLIGLIDVSLFGADRSLPGGDGGGWHYDIEWTGVERVFGGRVSRIIGLTDRAAFDAVAALLP